MLGVRALTRTYGDTRVLDDVSFDVRPGRVTGFVGANGAGKTTTMRIIMGVLTADSGQRHVGRRPGVDTAPSLSGGAALPVVRRSSP